MRTMEMSLNPANMISAKLIQRVVRYADRHLCRMLCKSLDIQGKGKPCFCTIGKELCVQ